MDVQQRRKQWMAFAGGAVCVAAAFAAASFSAALACLELASCVGKHGAEALTARLAVGARFGGAAARGEMLREPLPSTRLGNADEWCGDPSTPGEDEHEPPDDDAEDKAEVQAEPTESSEPEREQGGVDDIDVIEDGDGDDEN